VVDLSAIAADPYPAVALVIGGLLSLFIAVYGKRDDSHLDELGTFFAFVLGIVMGTMAFFIAMEESVEDWFTLAVVIVLAVTLFLRPMKELPWAGLAGLIAGIVAVYFASMFLPDKVFGVEEWIILLVIFFIVGAIVHVLFHFMEDVLTIARMVLDWGPVMVIVGIIAIVEGAMLLLLDRSLLSFF
jgi:hypothetical protein